MSIRARIYSERPDWWLLVQDDETVIIHRRYWTWDGAMEEVARMRKRAMHAICDGKCHR